jgi:hypothetical protein
MGGRRSSRRATLLQAAIVLVVIAIGLFLFWLHVSARNAALTEQSFRLVGDMTEYIRDSFATLDLSLNNAAAAVPTRESVPTQEPVARILGQSEGTLERTTPGQKPAKPASKPSKPPRLLSESLSNLIAQIEPPPTLVTPPTNTQPGDYTCSAIGVERKPKSYLLKLSYVRGTNANDFFTVQTDLGQMLRPICDKPEFDDVVMVNTTGEVEFQFSQSLDRATNSRARGNLTVQKLDPLTDKEKTNLSTVATSLRDVTLGGEEFKVFVQPLLFSAGVGEGAQVNWCVCGLVRNNTFRARTWEMSPTAIVGFLFVAVGFLLLWPLLNLSLSGTWEELRPRHVVAVLASSYCICAALTLLLLYSNTRLYSENAQDNQVEALALQVQSNLCQELSKMEALLTTLDKHLLDSARLANSYDDSLTWGDIRRVPKLYCSVTNLADYPPFSDVSWVDKDGMQVAKATPYKSASTLVSLQERNYFRSLRDRRAWYWSEFDTGLCQTNDFDFYLESVFSKTRNENCAVLARRFSLPTEWPTNCPAEYSNDFFGPVFSTITFQPISLFGVVLPAGCGFCLFERNGRVCFHSDEQKNLRENFIVENGRNRRLLAAIESRTSDHFDSHYHNATHHVFVMPLSGTSLVIAAFRNENPIAMLHRNMVLVSATLLVFLIIVPLLLAAAIAAATMALLHRKKRSFLASLWPETRDRVSYAQPLIWAILTVFVCSALLQLSQSPAALLLGGVVAPILGLLISPVISPILGVLKDRIARRFPNVSATLFKQRTVTLKFGLVGILKTRFSPAEDPEASNRLAYLLFLAVALVLLAVLPTFACYRLAFWRETTAFMKAVQFRLARDFQERRVQAWIKNTKLLGGDGNASYWKDTSRRRLRSEWGSYLEPWDTWIPNNAASIPRGVATNSQTVAEYYRACFLPLEETDLGTGGFVLGQAADRSWLSDSGPDKLLMSIAGGTQISARGSLKVVSALPRGGWLNICSLPPLEDGWRLLWYAGLVSVFLVPFLLVCFIGKHLLLFDLPRNKPGASQDCIKNYQECNLQEKLTLYQIAQTGFANGSRPELRKLLDQGLISFNPALELAQGLRQYVLDHFKPGDRDQALGAMQGTARSGWGSIRVIIGLTITAGAIFLFMTQQQLWQLALGFVSSFATAAQDVTKARSLFAKEKPESEK